MSGGPVPAADSGRMDAPVILFDVNVLLAALRADHPRSTAWR